MFRITTACFAGCLVSGCFSTPAIYPEHWAKPQISGERTCPSIEGVYANAGESYSSDGISVHFLTEARSLVHILNGGTGVDSLALWNKLGDSFSDPARDPNETVRLSVADGNLYVTAARADGSSRSMEMPVNANCRDGLFVLASDWDTDIELISPVAPEFSRKSIALGRAGDGSLLLRESKTAAQWYLLTPAFVYSEAAWIRFEEAPQVAGVMAEKSP